MSPILSAGLLTGVLCGVWTFIMGFTGWYKEPGMMNAFFMVVVLQVGALLWGLRQTAAMGRTYSGQVVAGTMMALIGGLVIIPFSLLFTTVVFPDYFDEINAMSRQVFAAQGRSEAEIAQIIEASAPMQTPIAQALAGFFGTFVTGVIASAVVAVWIRARAPQSGPRVDLA